MAHAPIDGGFIGSIPVLEPLPEPARAPLPSWRRSTKFAGTLFLSGIGGIALTIGALLIPTVHDSRSASMVVWFSGATVATALFFLGFIWSLVALVRIAHAKDPGRVPIAVAVAAFPLVLGAVFSAFGAFLAIFGTMGFARGRQLRRRGKVLLPPLAQGSAWSRVDLALSVPEELRASLAARWRENGRTEHASVAAFARLTLDLVALGAPAHLIEAANRDARDEIRHADLCFSLARALDGRGEGPGPFPAAQHAGGLPKPRILALSQLAVSSLVDGALHEGISARVIARLARQCEEPAVRAALLELAADEGRHSAHGWDVVEWCLWEGGAPVAHALRGAVRAIPEYVRPDVPDAARSGAWVKYGIQGEALEIEEHANARAHIAGRVRELTAEPRAA